MIWVKSTAAKLVAAPLAAQAGADLPSQTVPRGCRGWCVFAGRGVAVPSAPPAGERHSRGMPARQWAHASRHLQEAGYGGRLVPGGGADAQGVRLPAGDDGQRDAQRPGPHVSTFDPPAGPIGGSRVSAPIQVPRDILEGIRALCLALPDVTVRVDDSLTTARSTAHSFDIRRRSFCLLVAREKPAGKPVPLLVLRAGPDEREALLSIGTRSPPREPAVTASWWCSPATRTGKRSVNS